MGIEARAQLAQRQVPAKPFTVLVRKNTWANGCYECAPQHNLDYGRIWADERVSVYTEQQVQIMLAASPTPPQREPLTDGQIEALRKKTFSTDNPFCPCDSKTMRKAVWAAEAAHGIKGEDDGK